MSCLEDNVIVTYTLFSHFCNTEKVPKVIPVDKLEDAVVVLDTDPSLIYRDF